jgi:hypothetical protein
VLGQHWGNSRIGRGNSDEPRTPLVGGRASPVHGVSDLVEPVLEEVAVRVQRHRRRERRRRESSWVGPLAVPEHLLNDLDVGSGGDGEAGRGMPELMRMQVG